MPTEDEARTLLANAAATIDVDESAPMTLTGLPEPGPRRWPVLAAAAAVVLAIAGGSLVAHQFGDDPQPAPAPAKTDREPVEGPYPLGDDQIPSVLGYTEAEAVAALEATGLRVDVERVSNGCVPDGAILTEPGTGTQFAPGDRVTLRVADRRVPSEHLPFSCPRDRIGKELTAGWNLIRFARDLGNAPRFADEVTLYAGNSEPKSLTAAEASNPDNWTVCDESACHSALLGIQQIVSQPWPLTSGSHATPYFNWSTSIQDAEKCGYSPDPVGGRTWVVWVHVELELNDWCRPPMQVQIHFNNAQEIVAVGLRIRPGYLDDPAEITDATSARQDAAEAFVAWARGEGPAPEFADRVRVMFGGEGAFGSPGWTSLPEEPNSYGGCSGASFPECGLNPVGVIHRYQGPVVATAGRSTCADGGEVPRRFDDAQEDVVRLEEPESASCRNAWAVELWIDEDGEIYGVNQAG